MFPIFIINLKVLMMFLVLFRKKLKANSNMGDLPKKYFEFLNKDEKLDAKKFDSKNEDYRDISQKEKTKQINNKPNMSPNQKSCQN